MRTITFYSIIAVCFLQLSACKKEAEVQRSEIPFGALLGDSKTRTIAEVIETADEQYLICGTEADGKNGFADGYLMKTDKNFNLLWYKNYGAANQDRFESMAVDEDGNVMLAGTSYSYGISLDSTNTNRNNLFYIVFTDKNGNLIWEKTHQPVNPKSNQNFSNAASKVIYTKNKQFSVAGQTGNLSDNQGTKYGYVFGVNEQGQVLWSRNYNRFTVPSGYSSEENIDNMALSDDGSLVLLSRRADTSAWSAYVMKVPTTATDHTYNTYNSRGEYFANIGEYPFGKVKRFQFAGLKEGKSVINILPASYGLPGTLIDPPPAQLLFCDETGTKSYTKKYKKYIWEINVNRRADRLILSGLHRTTDGYFPCWVVADLEGNAINEVYLDFSVNFADKMKIKSMFINNKNEMLAFGILDLDEGSQLFMLRFDQNGNLIKIIK